MAVDANLIVRDGSASGSLSSTTSTTNIYVGEAPLHSNLELVVRVPAAAGTGPTADITILDATASGGTYATFSTMAQITAAGVYKHRFQNRPGKGYIKVLTTVAGTSPDFGAVDIYIAPVDFPAINKSAV